jgi:hypothetical protein
MRKYLLIAALSICYGISTGQSSWKFRSDNYVGLSAGEIGEQGHLQTVNGLYKGAWFLGLGAGVDDYRFRSIPLFLSVTRDLPAFNNRSGLFLYLDGGINLPWYKREPTPYQEAVISSDKFHAGPWGSAGLGYKWRISARTDKALLFSAGYSMKKLTEKLVGKSPCYAYSCPVEPIQPMQQSYIYDYLNHTFLFLVGFRF